jgi:hypothetical protein
MLFFAEKQRISVSFGRFFWYDRHRAVGISSPQSTAHPPLVVFGRIS